jgi:hypothetical protein
MKVKTMNTRRHFLCLVALAGLLVLSPKPSHATDLAFQDWQLTITEKSRSNTFSSICGGFEQYTAQATPFMIGFTQYNGMIQGVGTLSATSTPPPPPNYYAPWKKGSAFYGETIVIKVTLTRISNAHPQQPRPTSLHILSNGNTMLTMPSHFLTSTECTGSVGWSVSQTREISPGIYHNFLLMNESKQKAMQSSSGQYGWTITTTGTGNGNVYLPPTSGTGGGSGPGQIGETIIFDNISFTNGSIISAGRANPALGGGTVNSGVIGQYSLTPSEHSFPGFTPIQL